MQHGITLDFLQHGAPILAGHVEIKQNKARVGLAGKFRIGSFAPQIFKQLHAVFDEVDGVSELRFVKCILDHHAIISVIVCDDNAYGKVAANHAAWSLLPC